MSAPGERVGEPVDGFAKGLLFDAVDFQITRCVEGAVEAAGYRVPPPTTALANPHGGYGPGSWRVGFDSTPAETIADLLILRRRGP